MDALKRKRRRNFHFYDVSLVVEYSTSDNYYLSYVSWGRTHLELVRS